MAKRIGMQESAFRIRVSNYRSLYKGCKGIFLQGLVFNSSVISPIKNFLTTPSLLRFCELLLGFSFPHFHPPSCLLFATPFLIPFSVGGRLDQHRWGNFTSSIMTSYGMCLFVGRQMEGVFTFIGSIRLSAFYYTTINKWVLNLRESITTLGWLYIHPDVPNSTRSINSWGWDLEWFIKLRVYQIICCTP